MAKFVYKGRLNNGQSAEGVIEAETKHEAISLLKKDNIFATQVAKEGFGNKKVQISNPLMGINARDLSAFCKQFQTMAKAGVSIVEALDILRRQSEKKLMREKVEALYQDVQKGIPLSKSMKRHSRVFPKLLVSMVESGEVSGQLDSIMGRMAIHFNKEDKINAKVKGALVYPVALTMVAIAVIMILVIFVVPSFIDMFSDFGIEMPLITMILYRVGLFMKKYLILLILGVLLLGYGIYRYLKTDEGAGIFDRFKLALPVIGNVNRKIITMRFARTLSAMLASGVPIIDAMQTISGIMGNSVFVKAIESTLEQVKKGEGIAAPLESIDLFPPLLVSMIRVGEETGALDSMLETTADYYDEEVDIAIESMIKLIEPAIIIVMAFVVGGILLSIITPMIKLYTDLNI